MNEQELVSEIQRLGGMHYSPELIEQQGFLQWKLLKLRAKKALKEQGK